MERQKETRRLVGTVCASITVLVGLYLAERVGGYLLFHCLAEGFCILVVLAVFIIVWNCRDFIQNSFLMFIGIAYLFVGSLDFVHTLAYQGMGVFSSDSVNLPTQLGICARLLESVTFLVAPVWAGRRGARHYIVSAYALVTVFLLASIFSLGLFPVCYIDGVGLTPFKILSEYLVCGILLSAIIFLHRRRQFCEGKVCGLMTMAILLTIASELAFTVYRVPDGSANHWGHVLKMASFYLIYKALVQEGLRRPYGNLFSDLERAKNHLQQTKEELETRVTERTAALTESQTQLSRSQSRLVEAQRVAHLGHWEWDLSSGQILWSEEVYRILGVEPGELVPSLDTLISRVHSEDRLRVEKVIKNALVKGKTKNLDHRIVYADGTEKIVHQRIKVIHNDDQHAGRIVVTIQDITVRKEQEQRIQEHQMMLASMTEQLLGTEEREKRRVATALHDSIAQILAFAKREISSLEKDSSPERRDRLRQLKKQIGHAIQQTRDITFDLSPATLYTFGLATALEELAEQFSENESCNCQFYSIGRSVSLPDQLKILLYRSVRELLINSVKHAHAQHVTMTLRHSFRAVQVDVADDGRGFDTTQLLQTSPKPVGFGIFSIKERLKHLGGNFAIESVPGWGTKATLSIPIPSTDPREGGIPHEYSSHSG